MLNHLCFKLLLQCVSGGFCYVQKLAGGQYGHLIFGSCCGYSVEMYHEGLLCSYFEHLETIMKYCIDKLDPVLSRRGALPELPVSSKG